MDRAWGRGDALDLQCLFETTKEFALEPFERRSRSQKIEQEGISSRELEGKEELLAASGVALGQKKIFNIPTPTKKTTSIR